jgi:Predicted metal-dependent enzyme
MRKSSIGGSALIEGLMMISPEKSAIAIRKPDGNIHIEKKSLPAKGRLVKIPVVRGVVSFFSQIIMSTKAIMFSADFIEIEEVDKSTFLDSLFEKFLGDKVKDILLYISVLFSLAFSISLFVLLPNVLAGLMKFDKSSLSGVFYYNLFESAVKILLFLGYLVLVSKLKDIKRILEYHGAEHKTINCYENGEDLTVANVMKYTTINPRCSTSYLFLVIIVSIILFSCLGWYSMGINVAIRLLLMPVVAGLSFELFRFAGKSNSHFANLINAPGKLLQHLTTKEPDEKQVEVAISAFNSVLL